MPAVKTARRIDHLVLAARDLDALAQFFRHLGFAVGARNSHPWGTRNHIVQFDGAFLELIGVEPGFQLAPDTDPQRFSFSGFISSFLRKREGGAMIALTSDNAEADARAFKALGIGDFEPFRFARRGKKADGSAIEVAFTLAFVRSALLPDIGLFSCQHHYPENFWDKAFQQHANGVAALEGLVIVAENPADHGQFLSSLTAVREYTASSLGIRFDLGGGATGASQEFTSESTRQFLDVMTPLAFRQKYGDDALADDFAGPAIAGCVLGVDDEAALTTALGSSRTKHLKCEGHYVIGPAIAGGMALIFRAS